MEESGNKGLGSAMQSDTSLHDSALKWWDDCEANTVPFNEGLSLSLSLSPLRRSLFIPLLLLQVRTSYSPAFISPSSLSPPS